VLAPTTEPDRRRPVVSDRLLCGCALVRVSWLHRYIVIDLVFVSLSRTRRACIYLVLKNTFFTNAEIRHIGTSEKVGLMDVVEGIEEMYTYMKKIAFNQSVSFLCQ